MARLGVSFAAQVAVAKSYLSALEQTSEVIKVNYCIQKIEALVNDVREMEDVDTYLRLKGLLQCQENELLTIGIQQLEAHSGEMEDLVEKLTLRVNQLKAEIKKNKNSFSLAIRTEHEKGQRALKKQLENQEKKHNLALKDALTKANKSSVGVQRGVGGTAFVVHGKSDGVTFFVNEYDFPLTLALKSSENRLKMLCDLSWHIQVMRNNGVSVVVMVSEWLTPIFPYCKDFLEEWVASGTVAIHNLMVEKAMENKSPYYDRVVKAKSIKLAELNDISKLEKELLYGSKMYSLFDAVSLPYQKFVALLQHFDSSVAESDISLLHTKIKQVASKLCG